MKKTKNNDMKKTFKIMFVGVLLSGGCWFPGTVSAQTVEERQNYVYFSLDDCKRIAEQGSASLKNAELDIYAAQQQKKEALTMYFPKISIDALGFYALDPMLNIGLEDILGTSDMAMNIKNYVENLGLLYGFNTSYTTMDYGYLASAKVIQPLYAGGRIVNGNRLAGVGVKAAKLKSSIASRDQNESIEEKYWLIVSLEEKMQTLHEAMGYVDTIYSNVSTAVEAGLALESDLLKVRKEQNGLASKEIQLRSGIRLAKMDLMNAIGQKYSLIGAPDTAGTSEKLPCIDDIRLLGDMDDLRNPLEYYVDERDAASGTEEAKLLELSVEAARLEKKMEVGKTLPEVGVGFSYGYGKTLGDPTWNGVAFAKVSVPITDWWGASHKSKRYEAKVKQAENNREYLNSQLTLKVHMLWEKLSSAWEEMRFARESIELAEVTYRRTMDEYESGTATMTDLLKANTDLQLAQDGYTDTKIAYKMALSKYQNVTSM